MAVVDVKVPAVGESVQEAMIHKWYKATGDYVKQDDVLLELETDKATVEITAEQSGVLEVLNKEGDTIGIGDVIARIDTAATKPAGAPASAPAAAPQPQAAPAKTPPPPTAPSTPPAVPAGAAPLSPAVRRMVAEYELNPAAIPATGKGGRLTKGDVVQAMEGGATASAPQVPTPPSAPAQAKAPAVSLPTPATPGTRAEHREPMSMLRRRVAERLVHAQNTAAILTTFNEVDMTNVMELRKKYKDDFKTKYGVGLGFMGFFVKAAVAALKAYPLVNGWIDGNEVVFHDYYDIGVAVSSDRGLVVPVVRDTDKLTLDEIEKAIVYYSTRARDGKITVDELTGGTFTVSNGGVFGSLLSTPILNPPQSAILGMHKIQERPVALGGQVVIRPMMYLALSYDHRIVDGKEAVQFLVKIKDMVEDPTRLLLGV